MARRRSKRGVELTGLEELLDRFEGVRVLVVGDVILDEYLWGDAERVSPEAPVPVVRVQRESVVLGGAGNVARNIVSLGGKCHLCAVVGDDPAGWRVGDLVAEQKLDSAGLIRDPHRPTTHKTRVVARSQQMVRYDRESQAALSRAAQRLLLSAVADVADGISGVILADYGKGTFSPSSVRKLLALFRERSLPVAVDPKRDLAAYRGAALVKPNLTEAEHLSGISVREPGDVARMLARLQQRLPGSDLAVTRGGAGMTVCEAGGEPLDVATASREVFDVQGAGDTSMAALWLARLSGASLLEAALVANAAAGVVVGKIGTAAATREEIRGRLPEALAAGRERR